MLWLLVPILICWVSYVRNFKFKSISERFEQLSTTASWYSPDYKGSLKCTPSSSHVFLLTLTSLNVLFCLLKMDDLQRFPRRRFLLLICCRCWWVIQLWTMQGLSFWLSLFNSMRYLKINYNIQNVLADLFMQRYIGRENINSYPSLAT